MIEEKAKNSYQGVMKRDSLAAYLEQKEKIILASLLVVFIFFFTFLSFGRHLALKTYLNDLGTYDQAIWNTLQGHPFQLSCSMLEVKNYFSAHFSPILALFVPFYAIFSAPQWLLFFQVFSVALGGLPIYWVAKENLRSVGLALIFLASFFLNPFLHNGLLYDFHEVVLAVGLASFAFYFLEKKNNRLFAVFAVLLGLSQEHLPLLVFMMGLYAILAQKRYRFGFWISVLSLGYFLFVLFFIMPLFSSSGEPALIANSSIYPSRYSWLGNSLGEIMRNIFFHPLWVFLSLFTFSRINYLVLLILPLATFSLYAWPAIIALPLLAINLLSANEMTFNIFFYHSAVIIPFLYFAAVLSLSRIFRGSHFFLRFFSSLILLSSVWMAYQYSVSPLSFRYGFSDYLPSLQAQKISEVRSKIPPEASLSVQHNLGPHFSERQKIYRFPLKKEEAEYILLSTFDPFAGNPRQIFGFEYALQMNRLEWQRDIEELKKSDKYELVYDKGGYLLFRNKQSKI
jgi:uncharacterized membrane protein